MEESVEAEMGQGNPPLDLCIARWTRVEYGSAELILPQEIDRATALGGDYYGPAMRAFDPKVFVGVGFLQGVTWAVAAERLRARGETSI
jgi:hypothetical protein